MKDIEKKHKVYYSQIGAEESVVLIDNNSRDYVGTGEGIYTATAVDSEAAPGTKLSDCTVLEDPFPDSSDFYTPVALDSSLGPVTISCEKTDTLTFQECPECRNIHTLKLTNDKGISLCLHQSLLNPNKNNQRADLNLIALAFYFKSLGKKVSIISKDQKLLNSFSSIK